jgi:hypothetical protein
MSIEIQASLQVYLPGQPCVTADVKADNSAIFLESISSALKHMTDTPRPTPTHRRTSIVSLLQQGDSRLDNFPY